MPDEALSPDTKPVRRVQVEAYRAGAALAQRLPAAIGIPAGRALGRAAGYAMRSRRRMVTRHMRRASGGTLRGGRLRRAVDGAFDSYGRYWYELLSLPADVRSGVVSTRFVLEGKEHIDAALAAGNGCVVGLPHLGGWEYAGAFMTTIGIRPLAVAEVVEPPELFDWFVDVRNEMGLDVIGLGPQTGTELVRALRDNRLVTLVCDRDLTGDGVEVDFFGERTTVPAGPATLAFRTGAALLPCAVYFERGPHHRAVVRPPVAVERRGRLRDDVARVTQMLVDELEDLIRAHPEQWHLLQPNWPSDLAGV